jgi:succinate-acetate transporter protein
LVEAKEEEAISELDKSVQKKGSHVIVEKSESTQYANVTQVGLFSFSMMVGLETLHLTSTLVPGSVSPSYIETWGPYMFFVGGLMQLCVAIFQVLRNNVYGATAFFGFGCFWFSTGLTAILQTYSCASEETLNYADDDWGGCVRSLYILGFSLVLLIQTFTMNKLSTTLISLLCAKVLTSAFAPWSRTAQWFQFVFGWATSFFAFFVFTVETTNSIYHRDVFPVFRYSEYHSPQEVFGKSGRTGTLHSRAAQLRQAKYFPARVRTANQARDNLSGELSERFRRSLTQEKQSLLSSQ